MGFIILLTSILIFFLFGEISNHTTLTRLMECNNGFSFIFLSFLSFFSLHRCSIPSREVSIIWSYLNIRLLLSSFCIGAQFPQEKFLSYGRILTLDYYFLIMCILFSINKNLIISQDTPWEQAPPAM